jgi:phosphohistidine swiveling domain-containing protein
VLKLLPRIRVVPLYIAQALLNPTAARRRLRRLERRLRALGTVPPDATAEEGLDAFERLFLEETAPVILSSIPLVMLVLGLSALLGKLLGNMATDDERQAVLRSLPYNPTTEMDLALWNVAQRVRGDREVQALLQEISPEQLAARYREDTLPPVLQQGLKEFLRVYGHRAVAEIDLGLPRWSEDPSHILGVLANYLQMKDPNLASDVQFRRGAKEARAMAAELTRRARKRSRVRGALVGFCLNRIRNLSGLREVPKYDLVLLISIGRQLLIPVGQELARTGSLEQPEDIFFLNTIEARQALRGKDFRDVVRERRVSYRQELGRRHIPRILLSDGTEPELAVLDKGATGADNSLRGTPASAGVVTGRARVILDPVGARLEPGEILVAPSTDPGWTPLFLTAGGLVMEMGGAMSHGAVVAREYGIPAVVGLPAATERITTGQQITVDGSSGIVSITD